MTSFADHLWSDLVREHGPALAHVHRPPPARARALRRPRVLAGSTLGLAGAGTALLLALGVVSSPPAYAITTKGNGSVLVTLNRESGLPQANAKLVAMGLHEQISIRMAPGAAVVSGPVSCVPLGANVSGPAVEAVVSTNGTETIPAGNTGAGTWHLAACHLYALGSNPPPDGQSGPTAHYTGS